MKNLTAVIVDDEPEAVEDLSYLLEREKLPVDILATAHTGAEGLAAILKHKPNLLFLDIVMPGMSGFEMLKLLPSLEFHLIVTTSDDSYAIQAIRTSALDFLLKPVKAAELQAAVTRALSKREAPDKIQLSMLQENLQSRPKKMTKIALPVAAGVELVNIDDILYFESDGNYTTVHRKNGTTSIISKPIGKFEEMVASSDFFRVHHSFLINLQCVSKFIRGDGGYLVLENGATISVARNRREEFLEALSRI